MTTVSRVIPAHSALPAGITTSANNRGVERVLVSAQNGFADPRLGQVRWSPKKSLWLFAMLGLAIGFGPAAASAGSVSLFVVSLGVTLCLGHSLGMHRRLIHRSYQCPLWLERLFVYLGVLVGMAGPFGMVRTHDLRDWAQRHPHCHDYFAHRQAWFIDAWWQLHCEINLAQPPTIDLGPTIGADRFYQFLEATWMWQQLPWALLF